MLFGFSASGLRPRDLIASIEFARQHGIAAVELFADVPTLHPGSVNAQERAALRAKLAECGVRASIHVSLFGPNLGCENPGIWAESVKQHQETIDLAADLAAEVMVVHPGYVYLPRQDREAVRHQTVRGLKAVAAHAGERGVKLALENIGLGDRFIDPSGEDLLRILEEVDSPAVGICFDVGHANVNSSIEKVLRPLVPHVIHVHIHDNHGTNDDHLPVGDAAIDYGPVLPLLRNFQGLVIGEIADRQDPEGGILRSYERLQKMVAMAA